MDKQRKTILVVDDDLGILEVISIILSEKGYQVIAISDPFAIEQNIKDHQPDLLLMDLWMSGLDGHEVIEKLKGQEETRKLPVVIISALSEGEKIAKNAGADGFLAKPFNIEELAQVVEKNILLIKS